jgi:hypothetical protein
MSTVNNYLLHAPYFVVLKGFIEQNEVGIVGDGKSMLEFNNSERTLREH